MTGARTGKPYLIREVVGPANMPVEEVRRRLRMAMPNDVYDRIYEEHAALTIKLEKLTAFLNEKNNAALVGNTQWLLMHDQRHYMEGYQRILKARLNRHD